MGENNSLAGDFLSIFDSLGCFTVLNYIFGDFLLLRGLFGFWFKPKRSALFVKILYSTVSFSAELDWRFFCWNCSKLPFILIFWFDFLIFGDCSSCFWIYVYIMFARFYGVWALCYNVIAELFYCSTGWIFADFVATFVPFFAY